MRFNFHSFTTVAVCATVLGTVQPLPAPTKAPVSDSLRLNATNCFVGAWDLAANLGTVEPMPLFYRYNFEDDIAGAYMLSSIIMECLQAGESELKPLKENLDAALAEASPDPEVNLLASWCLEELESAESHRAALLKVFENLKQEESDVLSDKGPDYASDAGVIGIAYSLEKKFLIAMLVEKARALVKATASTESATLSSQQSLRLKFAESFAAGYALADVLAVVQNADAIMLISLEEELWPQLFLYHDLLDQAIIELSALNQFLASAESVLVWDSAGLELAREGLRFVEAAAQRNAAILPDLEAMHEAAENPQIKERFRIVLEKLKSKCDVAPALKKSKALVQKMKDLEAE